MSFFKSRFPKKETQRKQISLPKTNTTTQLTLTVRFFKKKCVSSPKNNKTKHLLFFAGGWIDLFSEAGWSCLRKKFLGQSHPEEVKPLGDFFRRRLAGWLVRSGPSVFGGEDDLVLEMGLYICMLCMLMRMC